MPATSAPTPGDGEEPSRGVSIRSPPGETSVVIDDPIERTRFTMDAGRDVRPTPVDTDSFVFPVDTAVTVTTDSLRVGTAVGVYIRSRNGSLMTELDYEGRERLDSGNYVLEICGSVKTYLELDGGATLVSDRQSLAMHFTDQTELKLGARSEHERPVGEITTTSDPEDMLTAVSALSSGLKTTSPERSFPTLRGHPPTIHLDDALSIPKYLEPPTTGIDLVVKPTVRDALVVAPLAYYLGARVVAGPDRGVRTTSGGFRTLGDDDSLEGNVEELLKRTFLLDCIVRTEGLYDVQLAERVALEDRIEIDCSTLYDLPIAERLDAYLEIPQDVVEDLVPRWGREAYLPPDPSGVEVISYLVDDLSLIRVAEPPLTTIPTAPDGVSIRGSTESPDSDIERDEPIEWDRTVVELPESDAHEQLWFGQGVPLGGTKAIPEAFENRLDRPPKNDDIEVTVVCNERRMVDELEDTGSIYGGDRELPFELTTHIDLTSEELATVLSDRSDFFHYIGHIRDDGFACSDGLLDVQSLKTVGVDTFLLNACQSHDQGFHMIQGGSVGGIVTLGDVVNTGANWIGRTLARLLNRGYPLYSALDLVREESLMGDRYAILGDGRSALVQPMSLPQAVHIVDIQDTASVANETFPTSRIDLGSMCLYLFEDRDYHRLVSHVPVPESVDIDDLKTYLGLESSPVRYEGALTWSEEVIDRLSA